MTKKKLCDKTNIILFSTVKTIICFKINIICMQAIIIYRHFYKCKNFKSSNKYNIYIIYTIYTTQYTYYINLVFDGIWESIFQV